MKLRYFSPIVLLLALGGCAIPPSNSELSQLPVIPFGQPIPENSDYILYFSAGKVITTDVNLEGNLFQHPAQQKIKVKLTKDIYSYKEWMSYDKQHWLSGQEALKFKVDIKIPGYHYPRPGHITLNLSENKE